MIRRIGGDIMFSQGMLSETAFIQHGTVSVYAHCIGVAIMCLVIADRLRMNVDRRSLVRGALLHDYFLYDWHELSLANTIHGYTHPGYALREAEKDFDLTKTERDMIIHHMFPLTLVPPFTPEGWILMIADKICALGETIGDRLK
jgi:uncharacterized protein